MIAPSASATHAPLLHHASPSPHSESHDLALKVDGTHNANKYDHQLLTIMVPDINGIGLCVGWCITTKENHVTWKIFSEVLKKNTKHHTGLDTAPDTLMSDDANAAWNGLSQVRLPSPSCVSPQPLAHDLKMQRPRIPPTSISHLSLMCRRGQVFSINYCVTGTFSKTGGNTRLGTEPNPRSLVRINQPTPT